ncbi:MAG: ATP-binding protein [Myxococcota bacterium]|nr:ATP-binding protein [Myxococcota bacterium]
MAFWVVSAGSALLLAALAVLLWFRRPAPPLWPLVFLCQGIALLWVLGDLWASHADSLHEKQIALSVLWTASLTLPALWWETVRRYVLWHGLGGAWLRSRWATLPLWIGGLAWIFAVSNPWHGQFMTPVIGARNDWLWGAKLVSYVYYVIVVGSIALCAWAARTHSAPQVRSKMAVLGGALLAPLATELLHVYVPGGPREDKIAIGLGVASVLVIYGITRTRLFNLIPVGLNEIIRRDPSGVLLLDRGGRMLVWNPAAEKLLESILLEPDMALLEVLGRQLRDARTGELLEDRDDLHWILTDPERGPEQALFRYAGGGGERWLRISATPIPSRRKRIAAVCLRIEDATREERAAQGRRDRERIRQRTRESENGGIALMASGVAHDFNEVLGTVAHRSRMALDDAARGLPVRRHLKAIDNAVEVAAGLTEQLQAYAHGSSFEREPVDLSRLVAESRDLLDDCLPRSVMLRCELASRLPRVHGDPTQLRQVLLNLVTNAGEAIGKGREGVVGIRTFSLELDEERAGIEPGRYVLLEVTDTGIGLDESERTRIFEPFYSTKAKGRGLGLAVVARIVESHRGAITVMCLRGSGATFQVWLPASANGVAAQKLAL